MQERRIHDTEIAKGTLDHILKNPAVTGPALTTIGMFELGNGPEYPHVPLTRDNLKTTERVLRNTYRREIRAGIIDKNTTREGLKLIREAFNQEKKKIISKEVVLFEVPNQEETSTVVSQGDDVNRQIVTSPQRALTFQEAHPNLETVLVFGGTGTLGVFTVVGAAVYDPDSLLILGKVLGVAGVAVAGMIAVEKGKSLIHKIQQKNT